MVLLVCEKGVELRQRTDVRQNDVLKVPGGFQPQILFPATKKKKSF
jgi:hypothetical protein